MHSTQKWTPEELTHDLKQLAATEGWDVFGIADPEPLNQKSKPGRRPIDAWHLTKSIICIGAPILDQWSKIWFSPPRGGWGMITNARFASARINAQKVHRWITDHGYHYNRSYAFIPGFRQAEAFRQAGLGWVGKSLLLVNPKYGSRIILQTIATDAPLVYDSAYEGNECGDCTICQQYCFSGCIKGDWYYKARQCEYQINQQKHYQFYSKWGWFECDMCMRKCPQGEHKWELRRGKWPDLLEQNRALEISNASDHLKLLNKEKI